MVKLGDGSVRPIEILKLDKNELTNKKKTLSGRQTINGSKLNSKKIRCGYCRMFFDVDNLPGGVSRMSIARLREKNNKKNLKRNCKIDAKVPVKDTMPYLLRNGGCRAYEMAKVCAFCFQFFDYEDANATKPEIKLDLSNHVPGAHHANLHYDNIGNNSKEIDKKYPQELKKNNTDEKKKSDTTIVKVSYPKRHNLNTPFTNSITISPRCKKRMPLKSNVQARNYYGALNRLSTKKKSEGTLLKSKEVSADIKNYYNIMPRDDTPSPALLMQSIAQSQINRINRPVTTDFYRQRDKNTDILLRRRRRFGKSNIKPTRPLSKSAAHPKRRKPLSRKLYQELEKIPKSPYKDWMRVLNDEEGARNAEKTQHAYHVPIYA
jgi:hypothetical protein